jgi:methyl-accepting chemotaxis protein
MSRGVAEAATGSSEIAKNIDGIAGGAANSASSLSGMSGEVGDLTRAATALQQKVAAFTF